MYSKLCNTLVAGSPTTTSTYSTHLVLPLEPLAPRYVVELELLPPRAELLWLPLLMMGPARFACRIPLSPVSLPHGGDCNPHERLFWWPVGGVYRLLEPCCLLVNGMEDEEYKHVFWSNTL